MEDSFVPVIVKKETSLDILKKQFASGQINKKKSMRKKNVLES
jgi:uncharacterized membrane protein